MKSKVKIGLLGIMLSGIIFTACEDHPGYDDYVEEQLVSATSYDTKYTFSRTDKVSLSDTVTYIEDGTVVRDAVSHPSKPNTTKFYNAVKANLIKANFQVVEQGSAEFGNTKLAASTTLIKSTVEVINYYPWWSYDWGWCYWDWWNCWTPFPYVPYPYPYVVGGYEVGLMSVDMFNISNNNKTSSVWTGIVRGLYTGTHTEEEINNALSQCFDQTLVFPVK